jgi:hypothetical protein
MLRKVRIGLGLLILAVSLIFLIWGYWPAHRELRVRPVSGAAEASPSNERALTLLYPPKIRVGETGVARLTLDVDALKALLPVNEGAESSNFYDTYTVIAEARFDLPGIHVRPSELISAPVSKGQTAVFYWTLRPAEVGKSRGTIWLYLRTVDRQTGEERRETMSAQIVEIESVKLLGLTTGWIRILGLMGTVTGLFLCFPLFWTLAELSLRKRREIL